jgi:hypothetical protein
VSWDELGLEAQIDSMAEQCRRVLVNWETAVGERDDAHQAHEDLKLRLKAFGRDCVTHGDMTPGAERMLDRILDGES